VAISQKGEDMRTLLDKNNPSQSVKTRSSTPKIALWEKRRLALTPAQIKVFDVIAKNMEKDSKRAARLTANVKERGIMDEIKASNRH
jgi:hypothetical protein